MDCHSLIPRNLPRGRSLRKINGEGTEKAPIFSAKRGGVLSFGGVVLQDSRQTTSLK